MGRGVTFVCQCKTMLYQCCQCARCSRTSVPRLCYHGCVINHLNACFFVLCGRCGCCRPRGQDHVVSIFGQFIDRLALFGTKSNTCEMFFLFHQLQKKQWIDTQFIVHHNGVFRGSPYISNGFLSVASLKTGLHRSMKRRQQRSKPDIAHKNSSTGMFLG